VAAASEAEQHKFAAFQYFTYHRFRRGILFTSALQTGAYWTEPSVMYDPSYGETDKKVRFDPQTFNPFLRKGGQEGKIAL